MTANAPPTLPQHLSQPFAAVIFDVDGVVLDTPHEAAWREALAQVAPGAQLTSEIYRDCVAGRSREEGALAALKAMAIADAETLAPGLATLKQARFQAAVASRSFRAFPDALRLIADVAEQGLSLAAVSASRNAASLLGQITLQGKPLRGWFGVALCGMPGPGKPQPDVFLAAARALNLLPGTCVVVEDAPNGIVAARRAGAAALGVARDRHRPVLAAAGADLVVDTLDAVDRDALRHGQLRELP